MRYTPRRWTFIGRSGREYECDVLGPGDEARPDAAVYVLAHVHLRGHLAGFAAVPVDWGHTPDLRADLAGIFEAGARGGYFSHVCAWYCPLDEVGREDALRDLRPDGADSAEG